MAAMTKSGINLLRINHSCDLENNVSSLNNMQVLFLKVLLLVLSHGPEVLALVLRQKFTVVVLTVKPLEIL